MSKATPRSIRRSLTLPRHVARATCAALALAANPALAQDAAPSLDLPEGVNREAPVVEPGAIPAPVQRGPVQQTKPQIVLPDLTPDLPGDSAESARTQRATPAERPRGSRPAPAAPRVAAPAPDAPTQTIQPIAPSAPVRISIAGDTLPTPAAVADEPVREMTPQAADSRSSEADIGLLAGLAGALSLGIVGFLALRSRRRPEEEDTAFDPPVIDPPNALRKPTAPVAAAPATAMPPRYDFLGMPVREPAPDRTSVLPDGPVPTGEARHALLERMVAAEPDEANPFTSPRARRRRARMILRNRDQLQERGGEEPFDWRTYKSSGKSSGTPSGDTSAQSPSLPKPSLAEV